jgi:predicted dehydrogenase
VKAAVIGCGRMGAEPSARLEGVVPAGWLPMSHAEALRATPGVELVALCDVDAALLERRGREYGVQRLYTDYRELLEDARPDLVTIATRTPSKRAIMEHACETGVQGIYVEKVIANSMADCARVLALARDRGVKIAYGVNRRYHAVYRHARQRIVEGAIGEVVEVMVEHGRSQLLWSHPHSTDLILFMSGATHLSFVQACLVSDTVERQAPRVIDSDPVIDTAFFQFAEGVTGCIVRSGGLNVRVGGTEGNLTVHADGSFIEMSRKTSGRDAYYLQRDIVNASPTTGATVTAMRELAASVAGNAPPPIAPASIELGTRMLFACAWSHLQDGRRVDAAGVPPELVVTGRYGNLYA